MSKYRLFWPAAALVALLLVNLAISPSFFAIQIRDGHLYGTLIDILRFGAPLVLVALGMTLVVATGGIDLSVGSVVAIGAAIACAQISTLPDQNAAGGVFGALGVALALCLLLGLCNGFLVSVIGIQPIIATLILMVAGRGLAQLVTGGQIITVDSDPFRVLGGGYWLGLPAPILIALGVVAATALVVRRSALGLLVESVGGNPEASRLAGVRARGLLVLVYVFCGLCAGLAGLMVSSNVSSADGNNAGLWIELDAILAVVIGGTLLSGGRFSLGGTVLGALLIQTLSTTVYTVGVPPESTLLVKALVVTVVCLVQSPAFRARLRRRRKPPAPVPASAEPKVEVPA
ncbi:ABC transporter permease [Amycolatopsis sp. 195334CR]|uniref:ABC transporter permease n=1 Tax=Amycolatopsis sp. 195334CR TaxID=2814588 RepID=UPI001A8EE3DA|nr:ABC transporter permease [Amycolatopsis sp. 195334CR]MBN6039513.1 ABC transporter permease [Amycolatopsis sp. 195334CR]